jgi:hypothetical protein
MLLQTLKRVEEYNHKNAESIKRIRTEMYESMQFASETHREERILFPPQQLNITSSLVTNLPPGTTQNTQIEVLKQRYETAKRLEREAVEAKRNTDQHTGQPGAQGVNALTVQSNSGTVASKQQSSSADNELLQACLKRANQRDARAKDVLNLEKNNKAVKSVKLHLSMLTNTRKDIKFRIDGTASEIGPRALLDYVATRAPKQLEATMQVLADRIVQCASANLAVDAMMRGEANYGLAYLTLLLCIARPLFTDVFKGSLEAACPFVQPGLKDYIENEAKIGNWSKEARKKKLGYKDAEEGDDEYIFRMQALTAFYAVLLTMPLKTLDNYVKFVATSQHSYAVTENPFGGLAEAWRWLAKTANGQKWRWVRFLVHSFLCIAGRDLSLAVPKQMAKLLIFFQSSGFKEASNKSASQPNDDDRIKAFENFVNESLVAIQKDGALKGPGRIDEIDGVKQWVDPRNLPEGAIVNTG